MNIIDTSTHSRPLRCVLRTANHVYYAYEPEPFNSPEVVIDYSAWGCTGWEPELPKEPRDWSRPWLPILKPWLVPLRIEPAVLAEPQTRRTNDRSAPRWGAQRWKART